MASVNIAPDACVFCVSPMPNDANPMRKALAHCSDRITRPVLKLKLQIFPNKHNETC